MPNDSDVWRLGADAISKPTHPQPAAADAIQRAAAILGLDLESVRLEQLLAYSDLLIKWNATYNLTAVREPQEILSRHIVDCLSIVTPIRRWRSRQAALGRLQLLDVGTGAGLPGIIVAIAAPEIDVTCVDSVGKKIAFVTQAIASLALPNATALQIRVEQMYGRSFDLVTSRAFAPLGSIVESTRHLVAPSGAWLAMKGSLSESEILPIRDAGMVFHVEPVKAPGLNEERCIVWINSKDSPSMESSAVGGPVVPEPFH